MASLELDAQQCICIIDPNLREMYIYAFDPNRPSEPPVKILLKPKTDEDFDL